MYGFDNTNNLGSFEFNGFEFMGIRVFGEEQHMSANEIGNQFTVFWESLS